MHVVMGSGRHERERERDMKFYFLVLSKESCVKD